MDEENRDEDSKNQFNNSDSSDQGQASDLEDVGQYRDSQAYDEEEWEDAGDFYVPAQSAGHDTVSAT